MLLVIFGAGASFDSSASLLPDSGRAVEHKGCRPPLANELFEARGEFKAYMDRYPRCRGLATLLRHRTDGRSVEQVLSEFQAQAEHNPARHAQLAAIKFYLQEMLWRVQERWMNQIASGNNYDAIIDEINNLYPGDPVCLVTFNYDTLLESALQAHKIDIGSTMGSYVARDRFSVIRLHGSVKWARVIDDVIGVPATEPPFEGVIEVADSLDLGEYRIVNKPQCEDLGASGHYLFPALAIPLENKRDFECPDNHLQFLKDKVPKVSKLLIIGWQAADNHFVKVLTQGLKAGVRTLVVSGSKEGAESVISTLKDRHELPITCKAFDGGFSHLVTTRGTSQLLESW